MAKFLVLDHGQYVDVANALSKDGKHEVKYCPVWQSSYPEAQDFIPGWRFDNLQHEKYFHKFIEWADCIVLFDVYSNDIIAKLRKDYPNKSIFGSGAGEVLENDRWLLKKTLVEAGLQVQKSYHIIGMDNLENFLKVNKDKYVKLNILRGDIESFYAKDYDSVKDKIAIMKVSFGPYANDVEFVCEDKIDCNVEIGYDGFFNGQEYADKSISGYEYHKNLYIGVIKPFNEIPKPIQETMTKLKPFLAKYDFRGALSTEEMIMKDGKHYLLDICSRLPLPLSAGYGEWFTNWDEIVYKLGRKLPVKIECPHKYVGTFAIDCSGTKPHYAKYDIKDRKKVKLMSACCNKDGEYYALKESDKCTVLIAGGNTVNDVLKQLKDNAELINGDYLNKDALQGIDHIKDIIAEGEANGVKF